MVRPSHVRRKKRTKYHNTYPWGDDTMLELFSKKI